MFSHDVIGNILVTQNVCQQLGVDKQAHNLIHFVGHRGRSLSNDICAEDVKAWQNTTYLL